MQNKRLKYLLGFGFVVIFFGAFVLWGMRSQPKKPLATADLGDGRILQVEGVTYGTSHRIGDTRSALLDHFRPWLPKRLAAWLAPKYPQSAIEHLDRPALVVWVNALDSTTGTNIDCQGIRVELVDEHGDLFGADTANWFGGQNFWREGHEFYAFPRTERKLTMRVVNWRNHRTNRMEFPNPFVVQPAVWQGEALPQTNRVGDLNIVLTRLELRTNGSDKTADWDTRAVYWEPVLELRRGERKEGGWEAPEWIAEDPTGNKSQYLGTHQPTLRFSATFHPSPTNLEAAQLIATLPNVILTNPQPTLLWNQKIQSGTNEILAIGLFPTGVRVFSDGILLTNPPVSMGAVRGGAPSGWTGSRRPITPLKWKFYNGHYSTRNSVIYLHAPGFVDAKERLAVRLRDERGVYWLTKLDTQGTPDGIHAFIVDVPPETTNVVPEIVLLKPAEAEFTVKVPDASAR